MYDILKLCPLNTANHTWHIEKSKGSPAKHSPQNRKWVTITHVWKVVSQTCQTCNWTVLIWGEVILKLWHMRPLVDTCGMSALTMVTGRRSRSSRRSPQGRSSAWLRRPKMLLAAWILFCYLTTEDNPFLKSAVTAITNILKWNILSPSIKTLKVKIIKNWSVDLTNMNDCHIWIMFLSLPLDLFSLFYLTQ